MNQNRFTAPQPIFALAVLATAILAAGVGVAKGDAMLLGVALAGLLLAGAAWLSATISSFLRVFSGIFAVEYVVFGLAVIAVSAGSWPEALADAAPPSSLPMTMAVFGILVWAVSFIPVMRSITHVADLYFDVRAVGTARAWPLPAVRMRENRLATLAVVTLVLINQAQVGILLRLSFFNRDWFNAIQDKNAGEFWRQLLWVWVPWVTIFILSSVLEYVIQSGLVIRWRQWLTQHYVRSWQSEGTHYRMALASQGADNPDQRIAEDVRLFIGGNRNLFGLYDISITLLSKLSSLVSFSILLWSISANFPLPGTEIVIPGLLFWCALIYSGFGTLVIHWIGHRLVPLFFAQQRYEADFRFSLARLREYAEQVALLHGERAEQAAAMGRFGAVIANFWSIVGVRKRLVAFANFFSYANAVIPYVLVAPFYFLGKVQLGTMTQTASAFDRVGDSLNFFVDYYTGLAEFGAIVDRLTSFDSSIRRARELGRTPPRIDVEQGPVQDVRIASLTLKLPDGRTVVKADALDLKAGVPTLITGPSGSGKSTLMRALAGIWPYGEGVITVPEGAGVMLLPQRPYIPMGTLREAVTYPGVTGAYSEEAIRQALAAARLPALADRLDADENWSARLSGGEQQRLALARALLARPDWLFLDEATAALDEATEAALYRTLREQLPVTTIVSIGHRSTLLAIHTRRIEMQPGEGGVHTPVDVTPRAA